MQTLEIPKSLLHKHNWEWTIILAVGNNRAGLVIWSLWVNIIFVFFFDKAYMPAGRAHWHHGCMKQERTEED